MLRLDEAASVVWCRMLLPVRSKNPPESFPIASATLILLNVVVFAATSEGLVVRDSVVESAGLTFNNFSLWRSFASMFIHGDVFHLLGNMWFLYLFGFAVEGRLKTAKFVLLYLAAGFLGDVSHLLLVGSAYPDVPMIGASGAIMGCLGAALYMFPFAQVRFFVGFFFYWGMATWSMIWVSVYYMGLDLLGAFMGGGGVAHLAHLGGALGGVLMCLAFKARRDTEHASEAKAMLADMKDLSLMSSRELGSMMEANPDDTHVALHWMHKSLRESRSMQPVCLQTFQRLLPRIIVEESPGSVAFCLASVGSQLGVSGRVLVDAAMRAEAVSEFRLALTLYEQALRDPNATPADQEAVLFRLAKLHETAFANFDQARSLYREVSSRFGLSPLAEMARTRLRALE